LELLAASSVAEWAGSVELGVVAMTHSSMYCKQIAAMLTVRHPCHLRLRRRRGLAYYSLPYYDATTGTDDSSWWKLVGHLAVLPNGVGDQMRN
jgi:hypothetical protein